MRYDPSDCDCLQRVEYVIDVAVTTTQILGPNSMRRTIVVMAPNLARLSITTRNPALIGTGITLYPGGQPLIMRWDDWGEALEMPWYAIIETVAERIGVFEMLQGGH